VVRKTGAVAAALAVFVACGAADAHGLAIYVSTPVSPPEGVFVWILPAFLVVCAASGFLILRGTLRARAVPMAACLAGIGSCFATAGFSLAFRTWGYIAATANTAPPPGPGPPNRVLWGLDTSRALDLFVTWNIRGVILLAAVWLWVGALAWPRDWRRWVAIPLVPVLIYGASLVPYVATGAYAHGWPGSYVWGACERIMQTIKTALVLHVTDHDLRLPDAETLEALYDVLVEEGILEERARRETICPVARCFLKDPLPYVWDGQGGGRTTSEIPPDAILLHCPNCIQKEPDGVTRILNAILGENLGAEPEPSRPLER